MKYYKIDIKRTYENNMVATNANGSKIPNGSDYFWRMDNGEIILDAPVFDYFYLESFDKEEYWEWMLADVYQFIGEGSQIKGWFISDKIKLLLEDFNISNPYHFYLSKLFYKGKKLEYYIFQFAGKLIFQNTLLNIDYPNSIFWNPLKEENVFIKNEDDFLSEYKKIYKENGGIENIMQNKILCMKEKFDFFPMSTFMKDNIVSERLKDAIEEKNIIGFEFSELDYEVVVEVDK